jgi:hypothetical protein
MNKSLFLTFLIAGFFFFNEQAHAARALDLSGNAYNVYILCSEDLGDFCVQGKIKTDTFIFDSGAFGIESFEEDFGGFLGDGEYNSGGLSLEAHYEAVDGLNTYEFEIKGLTIVDIILFGTMDIASTEYELFDKKTTEGRALFVGINN